MFGKLKVVYSVIGLASVLVLSSGDVVAQCSGGAGGGGGGPMSTGSPYALASNLAYSFNPLASNYPSSTALMAAQYQQSVAVVQNQIYAMAYQNAQRQRLAAIAREEQARPFRLARAEAKRAASAARIAARLRESDSGSPPSSSGSYSLTSVTAK